jgi:arylsulfatase
MEAKLNGREDPKDRQLREAGLPFRRRIEQILEASGMTWDEWFQNPSRERFDQETNRRLEPIIRS